MHGSGEIGLDGSVIPGRGAAASPEPMDIGIGHLAVCARKHYQLPMLMGSGPGPWAVPE